MDVLVLFGYGLFVVLVYFVTGYLALRTTHKAKGENRKQCTAITESEVFLNDTRD